MWIRALGRVRVRARIHTHTHTRTRSHGGERRGPCQFLRASTYALHTYRAHFFASPLLHIIRANNILCIICMPYAAALRAKSRNREPHRRSACPIGPPISLSLFYLLLLSQLDGHVAALSLSIKRGREGIISSPDRSFSLFLQDESRFFRRVDLSSFSRVFIFRGFQTNERTNVHPTVNDFGEYIWWERKRFESIVHIRPCTIGIAQIHLGDWSYK